MFNSPKSRFKHGFPGRSSHEFKMGLYLLAVTLLCFLICSDAFPDGAPPSTCSSLLPVHSAIKAQLSSAPFTVSAVKQGSKVRVTISSNNGVEFRGFILQARSSKDRSKFVDGQFTESGESKTIDCFQNKKNTLTHVDRKNKYEIVTEWTPRGSVNDEVVFRATLVKSYRDFWVEVDSKPMKVRGDGSSSELNSKRGDPIYDDCFRFKGCYGFPTGCASRGDCEVLLTYSKVDDGIEFAMHSYLEPATYMAMGLSNDASMGDDSVTECYRDGSNVIARESWNDKKSNVRTRELLRSQYDGSYTNGLTSCNWTKPYVSESNGRRYNLKDRNYYVLLAKGPMNGENLGYHTERLPSGEAVNFTAPVAIGGPNVHDAIKIHGTFMVTAWIGFVSMAILLARHFKNTWENSTLGGVKIWFALHRGFMLTALAFFVIAFIVIFVHQNGWNYQTSNPHAILGCIAVALGIFNPIMALFRPAADHKNRPIFNWLHWIVGNAAHIIAIITIFFAVSLPSSGLTKSFYWVMGIFVIVHCIFHLLYQMHSWSQLKKKNNDVGMNEMTRTNGTNGHNAQSAQAKNVTDNVFRILLLGIYCIFLLIILIALYSLIGVA